MRKKETAQISRIWISHFTHSTVRLLIHVLYNVQIRPFWWSQRLPRRVDVFEPTHDPFWGVKGVITPHTAIMNEVLTAPSS